MMNIGRFFNNKRSKIKPNLDINIYLFVREMINNINSLIKILGGAEKAEKYI